MKVILNKKDIIKETIEKHFGGFEFNRDLEGFDGWVFGMVQTKCESILQYCYNEIVHNEIKYTSIKIITDNTEQHEHIINNGAKYAETLTTSEMYGFEPSDTLEINVRKIFFSVLDKIADYFFTNIDVLEVIITASNVRPSPN